MNLLQEAEHYYICADILKQKGLINSAELTELVGDKLLNQYLTEERETNEYAASPSLSNR